MERLGGESIYIYFLSTEFELMEIQWIFLLPFARMLRSWVRKKGAKLIFDKLTLDFGEEIGVLNTIWREEGKNVRVNN